MAINKWTVLVWHDATMAKQQWLFEVTSANPPNAVTNQQPCSTA
jgi:hypothetical protein